MTPAPGIFIVDFKQVRFLNKFKSWFYTVTTVTTGNDVKNITIDYNMFLFNPFLANVPILYPLETSGFLVFLRAQNVKFRQKWINGENTGLTHLFPMHPFSTPWKHFQWVEKECIENKWVNNVLKTGVITNLSYIYYDGVFWK